MVIVLLYRIRPESNSVDAVLMPMRSDLRFFYIFRNFDIVDGQAGVNCETWLRVNFMCNDRKTMPIPRSSEMRRFIN